MGALKEIFLQTADENGWLADRDKNNEMDKAMRIAKNLLMSGLPIEKVAEATELPLDTIVSLVN